MDVRILGPLELVASSGPIVVRSAKQRTLLAALVLNANEVVASDVLIDRVWENAPASAAKLLQVYVSQLRAALGNDGERIATRTPGYVLALEPTELDSAQFERLLGDGREALAEGNAARAQRLLAEALRLWRGPALADFAYDDFARLEAERLEELRVAALEERIDADLALGRHEEVINELNALVEQHPLRERLWRQSMLALYRAGRQAEALECYARARRALRDELGLEPGEELRELQQAILVQDATLAAETSPRERRTNLPAALTPLLGREQELAEVSELLRRDDVRLLTLAGAGGSGKTALALELARRLLDDYANGVFLVELAPVRDAALVPAAIASALAVEILPGQGPQATLEDALCTEELLLVVDNAEHLPEAGPVLVELLESAPRVTALVTSRVVLHLSGERVFPVDPLAPEAAADLFVARAQATVPSFALTDADEAIVDEICVQLDHLPLAIELAAPRLQTLTLATLRDRLFQRLPLLTGGPRDLPARQQTLRDTLEWSYGLLAPPAQVLLARIGVFDGSFTLAAAEAVCCDDGTSGVEVLEALIDANLVRRRPEDGDPRFELLETIREFALEKLAESRDAPRVKLRHAEHYLALAESANLSLEAIGRGQQRYDVISREQHNLRASVDWATDNDVELGIRLALALSQPWIWQDPRESARRFELLLERAEGVDVELRARASREYGGSLDMAGENERARLAYAQAGELFRDAGNERGVAEAQFRLGVTAYRTGNVEQARELWEGSLETFRRLGDPVGELQPLGTLGNLELEHGDPERGWELSEKSLEMAREAGWAWWETITLGVLARAALNAGRMEEGDRRARDFLRLAYEIGDRSRKIMGVAMLAQTAAVRGDTGTAVTLWATVEAEEAKAPISRWDPWVRELHAVHIPDSPRPSVALALDDAVELALGTD